MKQLFCDKWLEKWMLLRYNKQGLAEGFAY